ncbi:MAG: hypothetical protein GX595_08960 [Lentisphaerae bacterium]|nr:hypothetical protein [Lentisphaerota bacterium]
MPEPPRPSCGHIARRHRHRPRDLRRLADRVAGFQVSAPFRRVELAFEVLG